MSLKIDKISFSYRERKILDKVSFELQQGELLFLLGPNGTGKTTLLKCINGILTPDSGSVYIDEKDMARLPHSIRAKKIGYVPQYNNTAFPMNVADTIMLGRSAFAGNKISSKDKDIVFNIIDKMGLNSFAFTKTSMMSGGERQRVFIARALAQEPEFILMDEPTSSLDLKNQMLTLELITQISKEKNLGIIMSIHDLNLASLYADTVLMLKGAGIYSKGTPADTLTKQHIKELFGVSVSVSLEDSYTHVRLRKHAET